MQIAGARDPQEQRTPRIKVKKFHQVAGKTFILIDEELVNSIGIDDNTFVEQYALDNDVLALKVRRNHPANSK